MAWTEEDILVLKGLLAEELKDVKHQCIQESTLGGLLEVNKRVIMDMYGNGHEGIIKTVPKLEQTISSQTTHIKELETAISGVLRFVNETTGGRKGVDNFVDKDNKKKTRIWQTIGVIIAALAFVTALVFNTLQVTKMSHKVDIELKTLQSTKK